MPGRNLDGERVNPKLWLGILRTLLSSVNCDIKLATSYPTEDEIRAFTKPTYCLIKEGADSPSRLFYYPYFFECCTLKSDIAPTRENLYSFNLKGSKMGYVRYTRQIQVEDKIVMEEELYFVTKQPFNESKNVCDLIVSSREGKDASLYLQSFDSKWIVADEPRFVELDSFIKENQDEPVFPHHFYTGVNLSHRIFELGIVPVIVNGKLISGYPELHSYLKLVKNSNIERIDQNKITDLLVKSYRKILEYILNQLYEKVLLNFKPNQNEAETSLARYMKLFGVGCHLTLPICVGYKTENGMEGAKLITFLLEAKALGYTFTIYLDPNMDNPGECGLIRISDNPEKLSIEERQSLLGNDPSYVLFNTEAYYLNSKFQVKKLGPFNFDVLDKIFPSEINKRQAATKGNLIEIRSLTGHTHSECIDIWMNNNLDQLLKEELVESESQIELLPDYENTASFKNALKDVKKLYSGDFEFDKNGKAYTNEEEKKADGSKIFIKLHELMDLANTLHKDKHGKTAEEHTKRDAAFCLAILSNPCTNIIVTEHTLHKFIHMILGKANHVGRTVIESSLKSLEPFMVSQEEYLYYLSQNPTPDSRRCHLNCVSSAGKTSLGLNTSDHVANLS